MSRRRKTKTNTKSARRFWPHVNFNLGWMKTPGWLTLKRSAMGTAWIAGLVAIGAAWILGVPKLEAFASQHQQVNPHEVTIRFINPPPWIKGALADSLLRTATMQIGSDPLGRDDLVAVRQSLLDTGWFDSVDQVRRTSPDLIEIDAKFVQPYTLIRDSSGHHLVDGAGKLLPKSYGPNDDLPVMQDPKTGQSLPMIAISGAHFKRPGVGKAWEGADVAAGLKLMQLIDHQPWRHQIAEIDVATVLRDGMIRLRTTTSSVILWGGPPGEEAALELLAEGKIERLNLLYQNHGRIDGGRPGELDITGEKVAVAR